MKTMEKFLVEQASRFFYEEHEQEKGPDLIEEDKNSDVDYYETQLKKLLPYDGYIQIKLQGNQSTNWISLNKEFLEVLNKFYKENIDKKDVVKEEVEEYKSVEEIPDTYNLVTNDSEVEDINKMYDTEYDSFFVIVGEGDYDSVYGMYGVVPDLGKEVHKVK